MQSRVNNGHRQRQSDAEHAGAMISILSEAGYLVVADSERMADGDPSLIAPNDYARGSNGRSGPV
jgi:hypothetical protein